MFRWLGVSMFTGLVCAQPLIRIADRDLPASPTVIAYGDMRFTDPNDTVSTNPKVRRWLADRVADEKPNALLLSGDVPLHGQVADDYAVFHRETARWIAEHILISVTLGNHEVNGDDGSMCIENWWNAFPTLRGKRWYSIEFGSRVLILNVDSNSPLLPGSEQAKWMQEQMAHLSPTVKFVFFNMHHPPMADLIPDAKPGDSSPRPNEVALADFLKSSELLRARSQASFVVVAGHIHNYERFFRDGTMFLISGGGGAKPRVIHRTDADLFKNAPDINYHYVKFRLRGNQLDAEMIRVADPSAESPKWETRDRFKITAP